MDVPRPSSVAGRKRRLRVALAAAGVVLLGAVSLGLSRLGPASPRVERGTVLLDTVRRGEMLREVRGSGTLVAEDIRWLPAATEGRVERILGHPGDRVAPDTVILELSNPELQDQLLAAKSAVNAAQADYSAKKMSLESQQLDLNAAASTAEADFEGARLQAEAEGELNKKGIVSTLQYKQSQLKADNLKTKVAIEKERAAKFHQNLDAQLTAERTRIEQLTNTYQLRQRQADALKLKAGIAGVLQRVPVEEGQQVTAGTNLARVAKPSVLMAELRIAETQAKDVQQGLKVKVDTRNGIVEGEVIRIDPAVQNGTVQVDVELKGELPPGARPDLSVDGTIEIERLSDVLYVNRPAFGQANSKFLSSENLSNLTLPAGLSILQGAFTINYPVIMAGAVIASVPAIILFIVAQRSIVEGVSRSGLKG